VASTRQAPPHDRNGRLALAGMTFATVVVFAWLVASLAIAAF
jgi:hypothetical protein